MFSGNKAGKGKEGWDCVWELGMEIFYKDSRKSFSEQVSYMQRLHEVGDAWMQLLVSCH